MSIPSPPKQTEDENMNLKAFKYEWKQSKIKRALCKDLENPTRAIPRAFAEVCDK